MTVSGRPAGTWIGNPPLAVQVGAVFAFGSIVIDCVRVALVPLLLRAR